MKIGIDIDGVVLDTERQFRNEAEIYDITVRKSNSLINPNELYFQDRFDWPEEEKIEFANKNFLECTKKSNVMSGAKEVLELLKKDGHELIVISSRGGTVSAVGGSVPEIPGMIEAAQEIIDKAGLKFDKYYWKVKDKSEICKKEKIDIMIDDHIRNCRKLAESNIKTIYLRDSNIEKANDENIKEVYLWSEIYRYIKELEGEIE